MNPSNKPRLLQIVGPGLLIAATGVGAGDLATGALTGSKLGVAILWVVVLGAFFKYVLNEGLARWQLATGETLLEGAVSRFGWIAKPVFLLYLVVWSFGVGAALMSACGITAHAILPVFHFDEQNAVAKTDPEQNADQAAPAESRAQQAARYDKVFYGIVHSLLAVVLVRLGGYRLFEKVMGVCIAVMFLTVVATAIAVQPDWAAVLRGLVWPTVPGFDGEGLRWSIALMGGVGGTLTILCYGYWIREEGRAGAEALRTCRIDLATGYLMTAFFGIGMVILGSRIAVAGGGANLVVQLADELQASLGTFGPVARWAFLIGAWGAVASSLLGVWQSVPYLFADFWSLSHCRSGLATRTPVSTASKPYRYYLYALATVPILALNSRFSAVQLAYAVLGAACIPLLAIVLLILNSREASVGREHKNAPTTSALLVLILLIFAVAGVLEFLK